MNDDHNETPLSRSTCWLRNALSLGTLDGLAWSLVAFTLALFLYDYCAGRGAPPLRPDRFNAADYATTAEVDCLGVPANERQMALVVLAVRTLDRQALTLTVDIGVCLPPALKDRLHADGQPIFGPSAEQACENRGYAFDTCVPPQYQRVPVDVEWTAGLQGHGPYALPVAMEATLGSLNALPGDRATFGRILSPVVPVGHLVLPLAAEPDRYPLDWYALSGRLSVTVGGGITLSPEPPPERGVPTHTEEALPFRVAILGARTISGLTLYPSLSCQSASVTMKSSGCRAKTGTNPAPSEENQFAPQLVIELKRSGLARAYVETIACLPLLLAIVLLLVARRRRAGRSASNSSPSAISLGTEALTGFTAALLAILPIRLVLVPADIADLTLVDYWLGFEMALHAGLAWLVERKEIFDE